MFATQHIDGVAFLRLGTGSAERLEPLADVARRIADEIATIDQRLIDLRAEQVERGISLDDALAQEAQHADNRAALAKCRQEIAEAETTLTALDQDSAAAQATAARLNELRSQESALARALAPAAALAEATAVARADQDALQAEIARLEGAVHQLERHRTMLNCMIDMQSATTIHNEAEAQIAAAVAPFDAALARYATPEN